MDTPAAEVDIDEALVRSLLLEQHPDLADRELRTVTNGWDNVILRLGDDLAVRMPRRQAAAKLIEHEQRWLPEIAERVSTAVSAPVRIGRPGSGFPWNWTVARWIEGDRAADASHASLRRIATALAEFVRQLHTLAPTDAPFNPVRGIPLAVRSDAVDERLASGLGPRSASDRGCLAPRPGCPRLDGWSRVAAR
jgi:aminoglycoside phosphotransferase (APT) family kinase protein